MHLLELIPGLRTNPASWSSLRFGERNLGKGIVWAKDTPNFGPTRIGVQGVAPVSSSCMKTNNRSGRPVGTGPGPAKTAIFKTTDLVGIDTMSHVAKNSYDLCADDEQRDTLVLPEFISTMVDKKMLGNKTRGGFYKTELTPEWKKLRKVLNIDTLEYEDLEKADISLPGRSQEKSHPEETDLCAQRRRQRRPVYPGNARPMPSSMQPTGCLKSPIPS